MLTRRLFVTGSIATCGAASLCGGCGNNIDAAPIADVEVGSDPGDLDTYGKIVIPVPMYPQLQAVGGALSLRIAALPPGTYSFPVPAKGVLLVHRDTTDSQEYVATRADCPHQGCPLGYSLKNDKIECPCHGSQFLAASDPNDAGQCAGLVVHPPAKDNLTVYGCTLSSDGTSVVIDLNTNQSCGVSTSFPAVANGTVSLPLTMFPALGMIGGSVIGKPAGLGDTLLVARTDQSTVIAVSAICTHQGCTVALDDEHMRIDCPCHGSEFAYDGSVLQGPASSPLQQYQVTFDGTTVTITV